MTSETIPTRPESLQDLKEVVAEQTAILPVLAVQLGETVRQIEDAVVGVCTSFEGIAGRSRDSVSRAVRFLGDDSKSEHGLARLIEGFKVTLGSLLDRVAHASEQSAVAIERLESVKSRSTLIGQALLGLNEIAFTNRIVAVNARIEAAHLGEQAASFNLVADEIQAQAKRSNRIVESIAAATRQLDEAVLGAVTLLEKTAHRERKMLEESRREVEATVQTFAGALDRMRAMVNEMATEGKHLSGEVSQAIRGMQFQDRTSQRVHHVIEALDGVHRALLPLAKDVRVDQNAAIRKLASSYTMQEENLESAEGAISSGDVELF